MEYTDVVVVEGIRSSIPNLLDKLGKSTMKYGCLSPLTYLLPRYIRCMGQEWEVLYLGR